MNGDRTRLVAATGLVIGALLGIAGTFAPTDQLRGLAWGIDGTGIIVGCALLVVHHVRRGDELAAAGLLVFLSGETLIVSGSAVPLAATIPVFGAGAGLWAAGLALTSAASTFPIFVRATGGVASFLFAITALRIFGGAALSPLASPLPFGAYPFLALTLIGWAWTPARPRAA